MLEYLNGICRGGHNGRSVDDGMDEIPHDIITQLERESTLYLTTHPIDTLINQSLSTFRFDMAEMFCNATY